MKRALLSIFLSLFVFISYSQSVLMIHEDCEPPSNADTLICGTYWSVQDSIPFPNLGTNHYVRAKIQPATTTYLELIPIIPDTNYPFYYFEFDHICKVDFLDDAEIQYHTCLPDTVPWRAIPATYYLGSGNYFGRFGCNTYGLLWQPASAAAIPLVTWWKHEIFNLTQLIINNGLNNPFLVRFKMTDAGSIGANNNYGWLIDNASGIASTFAVGINTIEDQNISVYSMDNTIIIQNTDFQKVDVYDLHGRIVLKGNLVKGTNSLQLDKKGMFIVRLMNGNKMISRKINLVY